MGVKKDRGEKSTRITKKAGRPNYPSLQFWNAGVQTRGGGVGVTGKGNSCCEAKTKRLMRKKKWGVLDPVKRRVLKSGDHRATRRKGNDKNLPAETGLQRKQGDKRTPET